MSPESTRIIAELIGAIVIASMTYYFTRSHYDRKRQDDLTDRESNRRAEIYDDRIQEVQAYIDAYREAVLQLGFLESKLSMANVFELQKTIAESFEQFENIRTLTHFTSKRLHSIDFLNDKELLELNYKLVTTYNNEVNNAFQLRERFFNSEDVDKKVVYERLSLLQRIQKFSVRCNKGLIS